MTIDTATGRVMERVAVPGAMMLNDVAVAADGAVYVSDSRRNAIFKLAGGRVEEWLAEGEIARPNGLKVHGGRLLVANNGDGRLLSADLATKEIRTVADLPGGILDGIEVDDAGNLLVSHYEGRLYRISPSGQVARLLDTSVPGIRITDFAWIPGRNLVVFPTWTDNRVMAYRLSPGPRDVGRRGGRPADRRRPMDELAEGPMPASDRVAADEYSTSFARPSWLGTAGGSL